MPAEVHYFGIRHHGPGSARSLIDALNEVKPACVLIEGPTDCTNLLPLLANKAMVPPVALLAYAEDDPEGASFWPFAEFSPEYQAVCWATDNSAEMAFIDLPVSWRVADKSKNAEGIDENTSADTGNADAQTKESEDTDNENAENENTRSKNPDNKNTDEENSAAITIALDPIGALASAAGYNDGESWWRDVIEENPQPGPVFAAVADAMTALRAETARPAHFEAAREAHMRLAIAKARKDTEGTVAVVCGAWHVPALKEKHTAKDDRALLKGAPKRKIAATWAPWTAPRLANASGYGAGVSAPAWCTHLWNVREYTITSWITKIARLLREDGHIVSTASLIETERLALTLAAMRNRPQPGLEDIYDAAIATLCNGNSVQWSTIAERLLIGSNVGEIPDDVPRAPLLEDLQRQQKKARLKPEALDRELSIDLRSDAGLFRSTLLHRLNVLDVPCGKLTDGRTHCVRPNYRACRNWQNGSTPERCRNIG